MYGYKFYLFLIFYINSSLCLNVYYKNQPVKIVTSNQNANIPGTMNPANPPGASNNGPPPSNSQSTSGIPNQQPQTSNPPSGMPNGNPPTSPIAGGPQIGTQPQKGAALPVGGSPVSTQSPKGPPATGVPQSTTQPQNGAPPTGGGTPVSRQPEKGSPPQTSGPLPNRLPNENQTTSPAAEWITGTPPSRTAEPLSGEETTNSTQSEESSTPSRPSKPTGSPPGEDAPIDRNTSSIPPGGPLNARSSMAVNDGRSKALFIRGGNSRDILGNKQKSAEQIGTHGNVFDQKCDHFYSQAPLPTNSKLQVTIVGGQMSKDKEFPHMAALGFGDPSNKQWLCGGSLISTNYVITAGHCLVSSSLGNVRYVKLGSADLQSTQNTQEFLVIKQIPHSDYNPQSQTLYNDLALLQLDRAVKITEFVSPICIWSLKDYGERNLIATGWGRTDNAGPTSQILQKVGLELFSQPECQQAYSVISKQQLPNGIQETSQICAGSRSEGKDTCQGDSGGPLQIRANKKWYLIGVTSFGIACGTNVPGVYTRISYYTGWIQNIIWNK